MASVRNGDAIALEQWKGHYGVMPLPDLLASGDARPRATFELAGRVPTSSLGLERRIACLSTTGLLLVLQRLTFNLTRLALEQAVLLESIEYVLEEADLLEEWLRVRIARLPAAEQTAGLAREEVAFDDLMKRVDAGSTLRDGLRDPRLRAGVRRAVRTAVAL